MKRTLVIPLACILLLSATQCSEAQAPSRPDSSARKTVGMAEPVCAPGIHSFPVIPTLQQIVEETTSLRDRLDVLACVAMQEHDRRVQAEQNLYIAVGLALPQASATDYSAKVQSLENQVDSLQSELTRVNQTVSQLCSAIKFSLAMNGTSATTTGGALWNACN